MATNIFYKPLLATLGLLLIPLTLQLTIGSGVDGQGFNWKPGDFLIVGILLFITSTAVNFALRRTGKYRVVAIALIVLAFLWIYAELAVGVFTNWGS